MKLEAFIDWCVIVFIGTVILLLNSCGDAKPSVGLSPADQALVQAQVEKANSIAAKHGYQPIAQPNIEVKPHDPSCISTSFILEQSVPAGHPYDNDGLYDLDERKGYIRICVGGRFVEPNTIQVTLESIRNGNGVWFETEHAILFQRDRQRYYATMYHTPETPHPILGE